MRPEPTIALLIVEDDERVMRGLIRLFSREADFAVVGAASVAESMVALERDRVEVVLTDLSLPDGDGLAVAREAAGVARNLKVVLMSGFGATEDIVRRAKLSGCS